jgi:hypothetical protein
MRLAYAGKVAPTTSGALSGNDARDSCEIVGDADVGPERRFEEWLNS